MWWMHTVKCNFVNNVNQQPIDLGQNVSLGSKQQYNHVPPSHSSTSRATLSGGPRLCMSTFSYGLPKRQHPNFPLSIWRGT